MPVLTEEEKATISIHLSVLETETEKLTEWEQNFLESISEQYSEKEFLSPKQRDILKKIYDKVC